MVRFLICETKDQIIDHFLMRKIVFVDEQKVSMEDEFDLAEKERIMFVVYDDDKPIGAARVKLTPPQAKVERVCILKEYRSRGIGFDLMAEIMNYCDAHDCRDIRLGAQTHAIPFYEKCGFTAYGELFYDANIPHFHMKRTK